jgi:hypothetical protein
MGCVVMVTWACCHGYRGVRDDIEGEDEMEAYMRYMEENPMAGVVVNDDDEIVEYDADGNAIIPDRFKVSRTGANLLNWG